ncbi:MAG TPA: alpha/beta hydrolase [Ktedonobacterales bacterium]|jgi:acetyl esterase/lipase
MRRRAWPFLAALYVPLALAACGAPVTSTAAGLTIRRDVPYAQAGGETLRLDAYLPQRTTGARPAVIFIHGGGWSQGDKRFWGPEAREIAQLGWVAFSINYRLDAPSPYPAEIEDVRAAISWVRAHAGNYAIDPARLALVGDSAGANLALLAAVEGAGPLDTGTRVRAAVSWSAPTDLAALARAATTCAPAGCTHDSRFDEVEHYIGCDPTACPNRYAAASPTSDVDPSDPPIFLANSDQEVIPLAQAQEMADRLRTAGVPYQLDIIPGTRHALDYTSVAWPPTVAFLRLYLGDT